MQPLRSRGALEDPSETAAPGAQGSRAGGWNARAKLRDCERWWSRLGLQWRWDDASRTETNAYTRGWQKKASDRTRYGDLMTCRLLHLRHPCSTLCRPKGVHHSTRGSRVIPQRSTNLAQLCLTSEIGRDRVYSEWFDRGMLRWQYGHYIYLMNIYFNLMTHLSLRTRCGSHALAAVDSQLPHHLP